MTSVLASLECLDLLPEFLELLHAVGALAAEVEEDHNVPPLVIGQAPGLTGRCRSSVNVSADGRRPGERAERFEVDAGRRRWSRRWPDSGARGRPLAGGLPGFDDGGEPDEDRWRRLSANFADQRFELAVDVSSGLGVLVVGVEGLDEGGERDRPGPGRFSTAVAGRRTRRSRSSESREVGRGRATPGRIAVRLGERLEGGEGLALRRASGNLRARRRARHSGRSWAQDDRRAGQ